MAGGRKLLIWTIAALVILAIAVTGVFFFRHLNRHSVSVMESVPEQTVALFRPLEMKDLHTFLDKNETLLSKLQGQPLLSDLIQATKKIDSTLAGKKSLRDLLIRNEILLALVSEGDSLPGILVLAQVNDLIETRILGSFIEEHYPVTAGMDEYSGRMINRIEGQKPFYYTLSHGLFCGSPSLAVLKLSVEQQEKRIPVFSQPEFREVIATSGKNVAANIYYLTGKMNALTGNNYPGTSPGDFAALDLLFKEGGLMLNGFFTSIADGNNLAGIFSGSEPQSAQCPEVLPLNTVEFYKLGFKEFDSLCCAMSKWGSKKNGDASPGGLDEDEKRIFQTWTDREVTTARATKGSIIAAFRIKKDSDAIKELSAISLKEKGPEYQGVKIFTLARPGLIRDILWPFSWETAMPHYCKLGNYILFCSSRESLKDLIRDHSFERTLCNSHRYRDITTNAIENCHIYHYHDAEIGPDASGSTPYNRPVKAITPGEWQYSSSPVSASQFTVMNNWFYANLYLAFPDSLKKEETSLWKAFTGFDIQWGPQLVRGPNDQYLVAGDQNSRITLLSMEGKNLWNARVAGNIIGQAQIMLSGKETYIFFNTATQIHKFALNGQPAEGFPVTLEVEAITGLKLLQYPDTKSYRILIPCKDNKIYNYDDQGRKVKGWKYPKMTGEPASTPQYLVWNKKDYLVFTDREGKVLITDRRGKKRMRYRGDFTIALHSEIYQNRTNSKGLFITTDNRGHLVYIPEKNKIQKTVFGEFSSNHYFFYTDINADGNEDFVYFDDLKMQVFDRFKNKLINIELPEKPALKPLFLNTESKRKSFFFQGGSGRIYLIDPIGNIISREEYVTESVFSARWDENSATGYLFISNDQSIILHSF